MTNLNGNPKKRYFRKEVKIMSIISMLTNAITSVIGHIGNIINLVKVAIAAPTVASVTTAAVTVGVTVGGAALAVFVGKKIFKWVSSKLSNMSKPDGIIDRCLHRESSDDQAYDLNGNSHRSFKDIVADTFANRHARKEYDAEDERLNKAIDEIKNDRESMDAMDSANDIVDHRFKKIKKNKPSYKGRFSGNYEDIDDIEIDEYIPKKDRKSSRVGRYA